MSKRLINQWLYDIFILCFCFSGPAIQLGCEESYYPTCYPCYYKSTKESNQLPVKEWIIEVEDMEELESKQ